MGDADELSRIHFPRGLELGLAGGLLVRFHEVEIETKGKLHEPRPDFAIRLGAKLGDVRLLETTMPALGILLAQVAASADHEDATLELTAGPRQLRRIAAAAQTIGEEPDAKMLASNADWMTAVFDLPAYDPGYLSVVANNFGAAALA